MRQVKIAVAVLLLGAALAPAASPPWLEIKSPHFTVITNAGDKQGRRAAWQFEQIRQALVVIWPWARIDGGRPITIFAVRDEATLKSLGPQFWEGKRFRPASFWVSGADRQYIALRTDLAQPDDVGENPYQSAYWNYVSLVFHRSLPGDVPFWFSRGVTEVLSNTVVRDKEIHVGRLMSRHLERVRTTPLISLPEFLAADGQSRFATRADDAWDFEAQAWAFVHFLMFANGGRHAPRIDQFSQLLLGGAPADTAMKESFGGDMTPYYAGMREYIQGSLFQYGRIAVALDVKADSFISRPVGAVESAVSRASVLVAMDRPVEARAMVSEASKADPASPGPFEIEGLLLDREGKSTEAQAAFARAADLGSKRGQVYYRLAQLTRPSSAPDRAANEKTAAILQKAIDLEPDFANALSFLADVRTDLEDSTEAMVLAQRAIKIEPDSFYHRMALARAQLNSKRAAAAIVTARAAMAVARTNEEKAYVQQFLDFAAQAPRPSPRPKAAAQVDQLSQGSPVGSTTPTALRIDSSASAVIYECIEHREDASCARAAPLLRDSCERKEGEACRALGSLHDGGFGIPMDKMSAATAYDSGCLLGDRASCARLAVLQVQGLGVPGNSVVGLATLEKLCGEKVDDACLGWALILAGRPEKGGVARARTLLQASCDGKNAEACRLLKSLPKP